MDFFSILTLFGGVGLFLYGMKLMGDSLKNLAGGSLEKILGKLTTSKNEAVGRLKGFALGTGVTAIIQSSAATTIMLIGFVNAGIMTLWQTIPVVFGANVGSTATAQILRLGDLGDASFILKFLKPSVLATILVGVGAFMMLFIKKKRTRDVAGIMVGLGILFTGMTTMEGVFEPLKESESFQELFVSFSNPALGILVGLLLTALIQSSSASVGILQALTATGRVTYGNSIPMLIGCNVGKCMTILLGSIGANKKAKRVSLVYLIFNIIGAIFLSALLYSTNAIFHYEFLSEGVGRGEVANLHLLFNLIMAVVLLPFTRWMGDLTGKFIKDDEESKSQKILETLDPMILDTPTTALAQSRQVMLAMIDACMENYLTATELMFEYDEKKVARVHETENFIDKCETSLNEYMLHITTRRLDASQRRMASEILNSISDVERIGDHCDALAHLAQHVNDSKISFSEKGLGEMKIIMSAVERVLDLTFTAFKEDNSEVSLRVEILAEMIDELKETIKEHHVNRLQSGECSLEGGFVLVDILTSLERMGKHSTNIAHHIHKRFSPGEHFDEMHGHAYSVAVKKTEDYKALYLYYEQMYLVPVRKYDAAMVMEIDSQTADSIEGMLEDDARFPEEPVEESVTTATVGNMVQDGLQELPKKKDKTKESKDKKKKKT